jgi:hypothetical protein
MVSPVFSWVYAEMGPGGARGVEEFEEGLGDGAGVGAGEADDADTAAAGWSGDGDDGVFELGHVDFLMVVGEKKSCVVEGVFAGVFAKDGCRTWFFDGEIVVNWW